MQNIKKGRGQWLSSDKQERDYSNIFIKKQQYTGTKWIHMTIISEGNIKEGLKQEKQH